MLFNNNLNHDILKKYLQFLDTILQDPQCYQHKIHEWISTESSETKTKVIKGKKYPKEPIRSQSKSTQKYSLRQGEHLWTSHSWFDSSTWLVDKASEFFLMNKEQIKVKLMQS